jgi:hypothetical protein
MGLWVLISLKSYMPGALSLSAAIRMIDWVKLKMKHRQILKTVPGLTIARMIGMFFFFFAFRSDEFYLAKVAIVGYLCGRTEEDLNTRFHETFRAGLCFFLFVKFL